MSFIYLFVYTQGIWSRIENLVTLWCLLWNMSIAAAQNSERAIVVVLLRTRLFTKCFCHRNEGLTPGTIQV